ncbi:Lateral signaling target protein 2 [Halocaridina rubra]|uniref:Lateral signaling target protein 2 homolog n=1 Tax=Halocaridina rubra TaxID=373956 RepID=A0AAN8X4T2_HALRR
MNSLRKWFYKPRKDDPSFMAQFYHADDELNMVAAELDSFDGRKDPERCTALVNQLRQCQDRVLNICVKMMDEVIPLEKASRDFRVKFPDDVMQENLAGQLWFGAECLAAGSSIMNREAESSRMRPLAKAVTKTIETVRNLLREQCLKPVPEYTEKIRESLKIFDRLFAEFELSYVSAMVAVKSVEDYDIQQNVVVLFSETVQRALRLGLTTQDQVDDYDPALMFTIPRLAIVAGLVIFPEGPLNLDRDSRNLSELFRPFRTLLSKIRELLWTMSASELVALEKALCSMDEPDQISQQMPLDENFTDSAYGHAAFTSEFVKKFYASYPSCKYLTPELSSLYMPGKKPERHERKRERNSGKSGSSRSRARQEKQSEKYLARLNASTEERPRARRRSRRSHHRHHYNPPPPPPPDSDSGGEEHCPPPHRPQYHSRTSSSTAPEYQIPPPPPPPYDSYTYPEPSEHPHSHQRHHTHRSRRFRHQPVTRIKTIACSCGTVGEYDRENPEESHDTLFHASSQYSNSQSTLQDVSLLNQPNTHVYCSTASTNCDSVCDNTLVNTHNDPSVKDHPSLHSTIPPSQDATAEQGVTSVGSETENALSGESDLTLPTANITLEDTDSHCLPSSEMCETPESCYCDAQNTGTHVGVTTTSNTSGFVKVEEDVESVYTSGQGADNDITVSSYAQDMNNCDLNDQAAMSQTMLVTADSLCPENRSGKCSSGSTSPYNSGADDDEEVALALQAAEVAATWRARARFSDSQDLIHKLFVCISGVADQLQTNYASDLRKILKSVFLINQSPPDEPVKSENNEEPEWSTTSPVHSYNEDDNGDSNGGNDSEHLSVESAEDALVVIGSPELRHGVIIEQTADHRLNDSLHSSPLSSPPSSPTAECPPIPSFPLVQSSHTSPTEIPLSPSSAIPSSSPVCPPSIQVPAAIFNDHALMQFSEVTQASIPPNVDLLSPPHMQYSESFGIIPEPYSRSPQDQHNSRDGVELSPSSPSDRSSDSSRRRPRVQEPPPWIPDQDAPRCMSCGAAFTMVRRRHHCRNCGKVFCAHCSQHAVPLPHFGIWKAVRVCNVCFLYYVTFTTETPTPSS